MQENKQDKYEFISEKIKDKPVNKNKLAYHVCVVVLLAVLFGIVASVTFVLCQPKIDGMLHPQEDPAITIPKDEPEQETETEEPDTETETNEPDSEPQIVYEQLTLDDFQTVSVNPIHQTVFLIDAFTMPVAIHIAQRFIFA